MALTADEKDDLRTYIRQRMCRDAQAGDDCIEREGKGEVVDGRHPACGLAEEMIVLVDKA